MVEKMYELCNQPVRWHKFELQANSSCTSRSGILVFVCRTVRSRRYKRNMFAGPGHLR